MLGNHRLWLIIAAVVALGVIALRGCAPTDTDAARPAATGNAATASTPAVATSSADPASSAREQLASARFAAMSAAVSTVHRYLGAVGGRDLGKADALWADGRRPAAAGDQKLRALKTLTALRIENDTPTALDSAPVPSALEVPVALRVSLEGEPQRRYRGWYRVRRAVAHDGWEITSASVDEVTSAQ